MKGTLKEIIENNKREGYASALIDRKSKKIILYAEYGEDHGYDMDMPFNSQIFNARSVDNNFTILIHNTADIRKHFAEHYSDFTII